MNKKQIFLFAFLIIFTVPTLFGITEARRKSNRESQERSRFKIYCKLNQFDCLLKLPDGGFQEVIKEWEKTKDELKGALDFSLRECSEPKIKFCNLVCHKLGEKIYQIDFVEIRKKVLAEYQKILPEKIKVRIEAKNKISDLYKKFPDRKKRRIKQMEGSRKKQEEKLKQALAALALIDFKKNKK